jgi:membrane fusion protein, multidrug efflux system
MINHLVRFCVIVMSMLLAGCQKTSTKQEEYPEYPVTKIISKDTVLYKEYVSEISAFRNVEIRARVQGYLDHIYVDEGQEVTKGQLLFRINDEEYQAALAQARANLHSAMAEAAASQLEVDRVKILVDKKVVSETELRLAKAKYDAANARIEEARSAESHAAIRLSHTNIRSPFDGMIDRIPFKIGSLIDEGNLLTTVSDTHTMFAYFKVSENEYLEFKKKKGEDFQGDEVELELADGTDHRYKGRIETMEGQFEATTGTIAFRTRFPNTEHLLKHGSSGKVRLTTELKGALMVPQKATFEVQDKTYVYIVDAKNVVRMKSFVPKMRFSHFYIVQSGLKEGEQILYEGIQNVQEGIRIKPTLVSMNDLLEQLP